jgi:hypothetical protein
MHNNAPTLEEVMQRLANENTKDGSPGHDMGLAYVVAKNVIRLFSIVPRVLFLRSQFGERYMQAYHVAGSWFIVAFAVAGASLSSIRMPWAAETEPGSAGVTFLGVLFLAVFSTMLGLRFFGVLRRRWANDFSVHSYSEGMPWWLWRKLNLAPALVGLVIEPAIILIAGYVLGHVLGLPMLQFLAWVVAVAHFAEQQIIAAQERAMLLDTADNIIEQRMARERLDRVQDGPASPAPAVAVPVADQQALQQQLEAARAQAAAAYPAPEAAPAAQAGGE